MSAISIVLAILSLVVAYLVIKYLFSDPNTLQSLQNGQTESTISASTLATNGTSNSSNFGYSVWFFVQDWNYRFGEPKVVFGRTTTTTTTTNGDSPLNPCPAVVLGAAENTVNVSVSCFPGIHNVSDVSDDNSEINPKYPKRTPPSIIHTCSIADIPLQKWVNIALSVNGRTMDLYLDGKLVRTCLLPGPAHVDSSADVHVTPGGGFNGWTSKLQYYPNPLNPQQVQNIYSHGYSKGLFNFFGNYQVKLDLVENGNTQSSFTL